MLDPLVPLEGNVTASHYSHHYNNHHHNNHYDHLFVMMKHFYSDESGLFQDENPQSTGNNEPLNGLMSLKMM